MSDGKQNLDFELLADRLRHRATFMREAGHEDDANFDEQAIAAIAAASDLLAAVIEAEPYVETLHSLVSAKDARKQVMGVIKRMRTAIAKAGAA